MATALAPSAGLKAAGALLLSAESLAGALLPVLLSSHPAPLALASCFGGGVFLAAALLHLLPHCAEQADALARAQAPPGRHHIHHFHGHHHGPSPTNHLALVLVGYLLVLAAERVLFEGAHDHEEEEEQPAPAAPLPPPPPAPARRARSMCCRSLCCASPTAPRRRCSRSRTRSRETT